MLIDELLHNADVTFDYTSELELALSTIEKYPGVDDVYRKVLSKGGFHAFSRSLRVFGLTQHNDAKNILWWNEPTTWKFEYRDFLKEVWSFAEDVFGNQFLFDLNGLFWLNNETGELTYLCDTFSQWLSIIKKDILYYTGAKFALDWHKIHPDEILTGKFYLCPIIPFVCGGDYDVKNLFRYDALKCLSLKADFARQIKNLPNGTQIKFTFVD